MAFYCHKQQQTESTRATNDSSEISIIAPLWTSEWGVSHKIKPTHNYRLSSQTCLRLFTIVRPRGAKRFRVSRAAASMRYQPNGIRVRIVYLIWPTPISPTALRRCDHVMSHSSLQTKHTHTDETTLEVKYIYSLWKSWIRAPRHWTAIAQINANHKFG